MSPQDLCRGIITKARVHPGEGAPHILGDLPPHLEGAVADAATAAVPQEPPAPELEAEEPERKKKKAKGNAARLGRRGGLRHFEQKELCVCVLMQGDGL